MSGLSQEECELLGDWWDDGSEADLDWGLSTLIPVVERIKRAAVNAALTEAADAIEENVDWSDGRNHYGDNEGYEHAARIVRDHRTRTTA